MGKEKIIRAAECAVLSAAGGIAVYKASKKIKEKSLNQFDINNLFDNNAIIISKDKDEFYNKEIIKKVKASTNESFVINDPDKTIYENAANKLKQNGYKIKIFNLNDVSKSDRYNPLKYVYDEPSVYSLVSNFISLTNKSGNNTSFWDENEMLLLNACIHWLLENNKTTGHQSTMYDLAEMINKTDKTDEDRISEFDKMFLNSPENSLSKKYYKAFKNIPKKTQKSSIISATVRLQPFLVEKIKEMTSSDYMELDKLREENIAIFIFDSDNESNYYYRFLTGILLSQINLAMNTI